MQFEIDTKNLLKVSVWHDYDMPNTHTHACTHIDIYSSPP